MKAFRPKPEKHRGKPLLTITRKKKPKPRKVREKPTKLRKARIGLSKRRIGQIRMRPEDIYENQMIKRLRRGTGMTHIQVMNLVNLAKSSDYIDVETEIMGAGGHSGEKTEVYEFAKKSILKKLDREVNAGQRFGNMSQREMGNLITKYEHEWGDWQELQKRKKKKMLI